MTDEYLDSWLRKAEHDIKAVEHEMSFTRQEWLTDVICFHCQQAAEKYLKALLIFNRVDPPKTHNIELLIEKCTSFSPELGALDIKDISLFGVDIRYPDDFYSPSIEEVDFYSALTKNIQKIIIEKIKT